jgi:hypothetical protein
MWFSSFLFKLSSASNFNFIMLINDLSHIMLRKTWTHQGRLVLVPMEVAKCVVSFGYYHCLRPSVPFSNNRCLLPYWLPLCTLNAYHSIPIFISFSYWFCHACLHLPLQFSFSSSSRVNFLVFKVLCNYKPMSHQQRSCLSQSCFPMVSAGPANCVSLQGTQRRGLSGLFSLSLYASPGKQPRP